MNNKCYKLLKSGYKFFASCYSDPKEFEHRAKKQGYQDVVSVKVRTDTPGLKMYAVFAK